MNEQAAVSASQKAELTSHLKELEQEIAQKEEEIRALEQQGGATAQAAEGGTGHLSMAQQTRAAMLKNAEVIRGQLDSPAATPRTAQPQSSTAQPQQSGGARIYPTAPRR